MAASTGDVNGANAVQIGSAGVAAILVASGVGAPVGALVAAAGKVLAMVYAGVFRSESRGKQIDDQFRELFRAAYPTPVYKEDYQAIIDKLTNVITADLNTPNYDAPILTNPIDGSKCSWHNITHGAQELVQEYQNSMRNAPSRPVNNVDTTAGMGRSIGNGLGVFNIGNTAGGTIGINQGAAPGSAPTGFIQKNKKPILYFFYFIIILGVVIWLIRKYEK